MDRNIFIFMYTKKNDWFYKCIVTGSIKLYNFYNYLMVPKIVILSFSLGQKVKCFMHTLSGQCETESIPLCAAALTSLKHPPIYANHLTHGNHFRVPSGVEVISLLAVVWLTLLDLAIVTIIITNYPTVVSYAFNLKFRYGF